MLMVRGTLESRAEANGTYRFDTTGVVTFMIAMVALEVLATPGRSLAERAFPLRCCPRPSSSSAPNPAIPTHSSISDSSGT
jgi:hypothetical protein